MADQPTAAVSYESFPSAAAGLYWLRWIDGVIGQGGEGSPLVQVFLSRLPDEFVEGGRLPDLASVATDQSKPVCCRVHAGAIPLLGLGSVFQGGTQIGTMGMATRTFTLARSKTKVLRPMDQSPAPKPKWWKYAFSVLPGTIFSVPTAGSSLCLVHTDGLSQLIIPASEVFRVFCGPEPGLADALLSGPWDFVRKRVVNPSWCDKTDDPWTVGLRKGLTAISAFPAAALEMTTYGTTVASRIYGELIGKKGAPGTLLADIPFHWSSIVLRVQGMAFPEQNTGLDRFLALRIADIEIVGALPGWPKRLEYRLDNYNVVHVPSCDQDGRTHRGLGSAEPDQPGDPQNMTATNAPTPYALPEIVGMLRLAMKGGPIVDRLPLDPPPEDGSSSGGRRVPGRKLSEVSAGRSGSSGSDAAPIRATPEADSEHGSFGALVVALDVLFETGGLVDWEPVMPREDRFEYRGDLVAWLVPGWVYGARKKWAFLEGNRRRSVLVAKAGLSNGEVVHLIEIERRPEREGVSRESFSLLLIEADDDLVQSIVPELLGIAVEGRGVWAKAREVLDRASLRYAIYAHPFERVDDGGAERLNAGALLSAMKRVVGKPATAGEP